ADREWQAGNSPRFCANDQEPLLSLPGYEKLPGLAKGWLGHPRPTRRDRGRKAAWHQQQAADRGTRGRKIQSPVSKECVQVSLRLGAVERAHGLLVGLRAPVRHVHERLCRERLVVAQDAIRQKAALSRTQDSAILSPLRHRAVEPRVVAQIPG